MKCNSLIHAFCVPVLLAGCSQLDGMVQPETDENRFYIYTEVADQSGVKTTFNPEDLSVEWDDDDRIAVLVKSTDENTWTGYEFIKDEGYNRFYCENFSPEAGKEYEYCLLYPSDDAFTDVDSDGTGNSLILIGNQVQDRTGAASHVETPLFGYAVSSSSESLKVRLMHICTLFEISLENNTDATITVSGMTLSTDNGEKLSGEFFLNFKTDLLFDAVIAFDCLWYIEHERQREIYEKAASLLKNGGYFMFTHGKENGEVSGDMMGKTFYYSALSLDETLTLLKQNGFETLRAETDYSEQTSGTRDLLVFAKKL